MEQILFYNHKIYTVFRRLMPGEQVLEIPTVSPIAEAPIRRMGGDCHGRMQSDFLTQHPAWEGMAPPTGACK